MKRAVFKSRDFRNAFRLHEAFRESKPTRVRRIRAPYVPRALMIVGELEFVGYRTTHGDKVQRYMHTFTAGSMPRLAAGLKRNQLFLLGGRYHVTDRGIVDIDARGEEIDDTNAGEPVAEPRVSNPSLDDEPSRKGATHRLIFKLWSRDFEEFSDHKSYVLADKYRKRIESVLKKSALEFWRIEPLDRSSTSK